MRFSLALPLGELAPQVTERVCVRKGISLEKAAKFRGSPAKGSWREAPEGFCKRAGTAGD